MKHSHHSKRIILQSLAAACAFATVTGHATQLLNFDAANYNAVSGIWDDISGNADNATSPNIKPTLTLGATPNGHSAVTFAGNFNQYLDLGTHLDSAAFTSAPSFTLLVVAKYLVNNDDGQLLSGSGLPANQGLGYRIDGANSNRQTLTKNNVADIASSATGTDYTAFHLFDVTYDGTTARFFRDGLPDGTAVNAQTFLTGIWEIGVQAGSTQAPFNGSIAGIQVYNTVLSGATLTTAQNSMAATYGVVPEPSTAIALLGGCGMLLGLRRRRA